MHLSNTVDAAVEIDDCLWRIPSVNTKQLFDVGYGKKLPRLETIRAILFFIFFLALYFLQMIINTRNTFDFKTDNEIYRTNIITFVEQSITYLIN